MHGLNELWRVGVITQYLTHFSHVYRQHLLTHVHPRPERGEQGVLRDDLSRMFRQVAQHRQRLTAHGDKLRALPQLILDTVEAKRRKV